MADTWRDRYDNLLRRVAPILLMVNARRGIGGQMLTSYECVVCGQEKGHGNTAAPVVCPECAKVLRELLKPEGA